MAQALRHWFEADHVDYTPVGAVTGGNVVLVGSLPLIAEVDIAAGVLGALATGGSFDVVKDTSTFSGGDSVYWNPTGDPVGGTAGTGCASSTATAYLMGYVPPDGAALTGDATVHVVLTTSKRTATLAGSLGADDITGTDSSLSIAGKAGSSSVGGSVPIVGGAGNGSGNAGGAVSATGGAAGSGNAAGGASSIVGGVGAGTQAGGAVAATGGASAASSSGNGGAAAVTGGALGTSGTGVGGAASLVGGAGRSGGTAGSVTIDAGAANSGTAGTVSIGRTDASKVLMGLMLTKIIATPVAATGAGGGVSGAAALGAANIVTISSDGATKGVKLPTGAAGDWKWILNTSSTAANLFAASGGTINGGSADVGCAIPASKGSIAVCTAADTWTVFDFTAHAGAAA